MIMSIAFRMAFRVRGRQLWLAFFLAAQELAVAAAQYLLIRADGARPRQIAIGGSKAKVLEAKIETAKAA